MKATCRYSGLQFQVQYFPYAFNKSVLHHPTFDIPFPDLLQLSQDWMSSRFTPVDRRLLFLSLLHSTDLITWRTYAIPSDAVIHANMDSMIEWAAFIHGCKNKEQFQCLPRYVISKETATLEHVSGWFQTWKEAVEEYKDRYRTYNAAQLQLRREAALERLIKDPSRTTESYASILAEWASVAASFPTYPTLAPDGSYIPLSDYWKELMRRCGSKQMQAWKMDVQELNDIQEHLEYNLPHGTIFAHEALALVRSAIARSQSALGILNISSPTFTILSEEDSIEKANILAQAALAPAVEPIRSDYPDNVSYLRAKARWNLAQKVEASRVAAAELERNANDPMKGL